MKIRDMTRREIEGHLAQLGEELAEEIAIHPDGRTDRTERPRRAFGREGSLRDRIRELQLRRGASV